MVEEWWAAPSMYKTIFTSPSYTSTEIQTNDGLFRSKDSSPVPYLLDLVLKQLVHPIASDEDITASKPDLRKETFGKVPMDCIMLSQQIKNVAYLPLGLFPTYCFDRDQDSLRVSYDFGSQLITRNHVGKFLERNVAIDQTTSFSSVNAITAHVEGLQTMPLNDDDFVPPTEFEKTSAKVTKVSSGVISGLAISKTPPIYPVHAKEMRVTGSVVMAARIGRDGRIHSLKLMSVPDPDLAIAALTAVRQWVYKPYLLNGEPVDVDTMITVNFAMGR